MCSPVGLARDTLSSDVDARKSGFHVAHLISNLGLGGAENSLCTLVEATGSHVRHTVITMLSGNPLAARLRDRGVQVIELPGRRGPVGAFQFRAIARALAQSRADVVQCWMYHANFAASALQTVGLAGRPVVWGIRQGLSTLKMERRTTQALIVASVPLARLPRWIVYNSQEAADEHERVGYPQASRVVIENGVDTERFKPRPGAKAQLCGMIGLPEDTEIIGRVARFAPMKDFQTLMEAFSIVATRRPKARLAIVGLVPGAEQLQVCALAEAFGCRDRVFVLPPRLDIEEFCSGIDIAVSTSCANEGFPNFLAEALASGTMVVSTAVGSSRLVRGGCHIVVEPKQPLAIATAVDNLLALDRAGRDRLSARGRRFIVSNFGTELFADRYLLLWGQVTAAR